MSLAGEWGDRWSSEGGPRKGLIAPTTLIVPPSPLQTPPPLNPEHRTGRAPFGSIALGNNVVSPPSHQPKFIRSTLSRERDTFILSGKTAWKSIVERRCFRLVFFFFFQNFHSKVMEFLKGCNRTAR